MKLKLSLMWGTAFAVLAVVALLATADTARAQTFNPTYELTIADPQAGANSDLTLDFGVPKGDVNFGGAVFFIPAEWGIPRGDEIPIGAIVGELTATATLGLFNNACDNVLPVRFIMLNASIDPSDTVSFLDTEEDDPNAEGFGTEDYAEDKDASGLQDGFEKYPDFITRILDDIPGDEVGNPLQPIRRSAGITVVAGVTVLLQFLVFEPGTFINENIPNDAELGFPTVTLLQNIGDPDSDPIPSAITDFCSPLISTNITFGISRDNACTAAGTLDPLCEVSSVIPEVEEVTDPDESGFILSTNPPEGTYTFTTIAAGQRDADGDGYENALDTCPFVANVGDPRIGGDGDEDNDGLDAACDPNDDFQAGGTNSDEDLDGFTNRQDNCPLVANGENEDNQRDTDNDAIGDACDPNPDDEEAQGELIIVETTQDVTIGPGGPPSQETPTGLETPAAEETPAGGTPGDE